MYVCDSGHSTKMYVSICIILRFLLSILLPVVAICVLRVENSDLSCLDLLSDSLHLVWCHGTLRTARRLRTNWTIPNTFLRVVSFFVVFWVNTFGFVYPFYPRFRAQWSWYLLSPPTRFHGGYRLYYSSFSFISQSLSSISSIICCAISDQFTSCIKAWAYDNANDLEGTSISIIDSA